MAQLQQPDAAGFEIGALAPAGTYIATCLEVEDQFGVERAKFENPQEKEILDVTRFLFGFKGQDGRPYKVQSFEFRISGSPKSNLFKFLTSWLGNPPKYGWDYCELKGQGAMITVAHKQSRDGTKTYANLVGISPVIDQLKGQVIPLAAFGATPAADPTPPPSATPPPMGGLASVPAATPTPFPPQAFAPPSGGLASVPAATPPQAFAPPVQAFTPPPATGWNPAVDADVECPF